MEDLESKAEAYQVIDIDFDQSLNHTSRLWFFLIHAYTCLSGFYGYVWFTVIDVCKMYVCTYVCLSPNIGPG